MDDQILTALRARAANIRERWEALLRVERVNTPLAHPDSLTYLIPETTERIFKTLGKTKRPPALDKALRIPRPECLCGGNPYLAYFAAGEQALIEALVLVQSDLPAQGKRDEDLAAMYAVVRTLAAREIEAFRGVCALRAGNPACNGKTCNAARPPETDACLVSPH